MYLRAGTAAAGTDKCAKGHTQERMQVEAHARANGRTRGRTNALQVTGAHAHGITNSLLRSYARTLYVKSVPYSLAISTSHCVSRRRHDATHKTVQDNPRTASAQRKTTTKASAQPLLAAARLLQQTMGVAHYGWLARPIFCKIDKGAPQVNRRRQNFE